MTKKVKKPKRFSIASYRKKVGDYDGVSRKGLTKYRKSVGDEKK
jgi:hypothetical protein